MTMNYNKLKGRITEKFGTQTNFSKALNVSERTLSLKLNNEIDWKQSEICKAASLLDFPAEEITAYFFTPDVQNT